MTTKILQLVNSAFFGLPQSASSVSDAAMYLGLATLRSLVLSVQVFSQFTARTIEEFSIDAVSQHCWLTGVIARQIAQAEHCDAKADDQCFLGGLLHDMGCLILADGLPEQYSRVLRLAKESGRPLWEVEQAELGASHAEVGAYLLGLWGLPVVGIEAVALHHRPSASLVPGFSPVIAVHVADYLAHRLAPGHLEPPNRQIDRAHLEKLGLLARLPEWEQLCLSEPR